MPTLKEVPGFVAALADDVAKASVATKAIARIFFVMFHLFLYVVSSLIRVSRFVKICKHIVIFML